ncbi:hypothetical protein CI238_10133, partial [Colletotrichum incanum]
LSLRMNEQPPTMTWNSRLMQCPHPKIIPKICSFVSESPTGGAYCTREHRSSPYQTHDMIPYSPPLFSFLTFDS